MSIDLKNLTYHYSDFPVFQPVTFRASQGQFIHIDGENGTGKTTLLKLLAGILKPKTGLVSFERSESRMNHSLYISHKNTLWPDLTVDGMLDYYMRVFSVIISGVEKENILSKIGLQNLKYMKIKNLSFGQKRRLSLSRLLLKSASIWLIDEPFTGVDNKSIQIFLEIFKALLSQKGIIFIAAHDKVNDWGITHTKLTLKGEDHALS